MDNDNAESDIKMQVPESQIVITDNGADIQTGKSDSIRDSNTVKTGQGRPAPLADMATLPHDNTNQNELKSMADKAAICIMRRIQIALDSADWATLDRIMPHAMKLLDAQMAMEWSIKWQKSILEKPQHMTGIKQVGTLSAINQGRAVKARKQEKGDGRTTPKRLIKELPLDDVA